MSLENVAVQRSRQLSLLGMLLLAMHVLFGITAIMGMLIAHTKLNSTNGTIYRSHLRWQLVTFWLALPGYVMAAWSWLSLGLKWPILVVAGFVAYRLSVNLHYWLARRPLDRIL